MAIPLEPESGLFPGIDVDPFEQSDEVKELAGHVIHRWPEFEPIREAIGDGLRIAFVWDNKGFDPTKDEYKRHVIAKVTKASPLWTYLAETELVVQFRRWFWDQFDETQREAVLYHELRHIDVTEGDDKGPKVRLAPHEVEEFYGVARRYGHALPALERLIKVHGWHELEASGQVSVVPDEESKGEA